ncbi:MAG: hypothetical protein CM15mV67_010 [uncultured marine virus]|nr:MAG: hypothetical protein CM15mV67_010 [uncultured marine virus]
MEPKEQFGVIFLVKVVILILCMNIGKKIRLHPRTECLETPIEDPKKIALYENAQWYNWEIKKRLNNPNPKRI